MHGPIDSRPMRIYDKKDPTAYNLRPGLLATSTVLERNR